MRTPVYKLFEKGKQLKKPVLIGDVLELYCDYAVVRESGDLCKTRLNLGTATLKDRTLTVVGHEDTDFNKHTQTWVCTIPNYRVL